MSETKLTFKYMHMLFKKFTKRYIFNEVELFPTHSSIYFDPLYFENYFGFAKSVKTTGSLVKDLQNKVKFTKKFFNPHIAITKFHYKQIF